MDYRFRISALSPLMPGVLQNVGAERKSLFKRQRRPIGKGTLLIIGISPLWESSWAAHNQRNATHVSVNLKAMKLKPALRPADHQNRMLACHRFVDGFTHYQLDLPRQPRNSKTAADAPTR
jgi:hypothetical protein